MTVVKKMTSNEIRGEVNQLLKLNLATAFLGGRRVQWISHWYSYHGRGDGGYDLSRPFATYSDNGFFEDVPISCDTLITVHLYEDALPSDIVLADS